MYSCVSVFAWLPRSVSTTGDVLVTSRICPAAADSQVEVRDDGHSHADDYARLCLRCKAGDLSCHAVVSGQ